MLFCTLTSAHLHNRRHHFLTNTSQRPGIEQWEPKNCMRYLTQPAKICQGVAKHRRQCTHRHSNFKFEWYRAFINRFFWAQRNCEHHFLTNSCNYKDQGLSNGNPQIACAVSPNQLKFVTVWQNIDENARIATQTLNLSGIVHLSTGSSKHKGAANITSWPNYKDQGLSNSICTHSHPHLL